MIEDVRTRVSRGRVRRVLALLMCGVGVDESVDVVMSGDVARVSVGGRVFEVPVSYVPRFVLDVIIEVLDIAGNKVLEYPVWWEEVSEIRKEKINELCKKLSHEKILLNIGNKVIELDMRRTVSVAIALLDKAWTEVRL